MEPPPHKQPKLSSYKASSSSDFFNFGVQLHCTKTGLIDKEEIKVESPPQDILDVKKQIERQFSIPVCVQTVSFNGDTLKDNIKLSDLKVRNGDTFHVQYLAKGNCTDLMETIFWLSQLSNAMISKKTNLNSVVQIGIQQRLLENLQASFSWDDPTSKSYVNKLFFAGNDGVNVILRVYEFLLHKNWNEMDQHFKYFELWIIATMCCFAETFPLCRLLIQHNIIKMLTQSLLRVKLKEGKRIHDCDTSGDQVQQSLLVHTICCSIEFLSNLMELPVDQHRLMIASNKDILHQVSCVSIVPDLSIASSRAVATFFCNLAFTPQAHQYIADSVCIQRLFKACEKFSNDPAQPLLEYYTFLSVIQVCLISPHCLESDQLVCAITKKIDLFLRNNSYEGIRDAETNLEDFTCLLFIPYVKLAYIPNAPQTENTSIGKLQLVSLQLAIFALRNMLSREDHRQILLKEGLLDFVVCMPQYVPPSLRPQAEELVQMVASSPDIPEGPPKLLNLVKARLAKTYFGLEQVLSLSVSETWAVYQ